MLSDSFTPSAAAGVPQMLLVKLPDQIEWRMSAIKLKSLTITPGVSRSLTIHFAGVPFKGVHL